jgi:hypothetical protein
LPASSHQTTRPPDTRFEPGVRNQESDLWSIFAEPVSPLHIPHSAFRTPPSPGSPVSALSAPLRDTLFARLDENGGARMDSEFEEDDPDDQNERAPESEDGLDLWSVLYGLDS